MVTVTVAVMLAYKTPVVRDFGDTDDALRLVMVRDLLAGQGWFHPLVTRLDPPHGLYTHWSRLLDGGLAGSIALARLVLPPAAAELAVRVLWPLAWIYPAVLSCLILARRLAGSAAVAVTAILLVANLILYQQFRPGRIDHHDVQIVMALVATAGAVGVRDARRGAVIAGVATALGLAVGLEAAAFEALVGASFMVRLLRDRGEAAAALAYGLSLALTALAAFVAQTPPWRWGLAACDSLAVNGLAAVALAGLGLALVAWRAPVLSGRQRVMALAAVGPVAMVAALAFDPSCVHGPFAGVDPAVRRLWLDRVLEVQPIGLVLRLSRLNGVSALVFLAETAVAAACLIGRLATASARPAGELAGEPGTARRPYVEVISSRPALGLVLGLALAAAIMGLEVWRMTAYAFWFGAPLLGAGLASVGAKDGDVWASRKLPAAALGALLSPSLISLLAVRILAWIVPVSPATEIDPAVRGPCFAPQSYARLARLPPGTVLAEPDLGPFVLLFTRDSALSAPYHRIGGAIVRAHEALDGPPGEDEARTRALGASYVVSCRGLPAMGRRPGLDARLRAGVVPSWLTPLSSPGESLQIYAVRGSGPPGLSDATRRAPG